MSIDWTELQTALSPVKDYEDLSNRLRGSLGFAYVREAYDFSMPELIAYTRRLLEGDTRGRYAGYSARLVHIATALHEAGVRGVRDLVARTETRQLLEDLTARTGVDARDTVMLLKYLLYWVIPMEKPLGPLVQEDPAGGDAGRLLRELGIRTNLELLERGNTPAGRQALAAATGLPAGVILRLVHRADLSRMPWSSRATIGTIVGAGYGSVARLAGGDLEHMRADFERYGQAVGKNIKRAIELENNHRMAKIVPALVQEG